MRALLIAGLGPTIKGADLLAGSSFAPDHDAVRAGSIAAPVDLSHLHVHEPTGSYPLLRPLRPGQPPSIPTTPGPRSQHFPHLTTLTLQTILRSVGVEHDTLTTDTIWHDREPPSQSQCYEVVLLSTTFMWEPRALARAIAWTTRYFPDSTLVLGGQYSNLKYPLILQHHHRVDYVVRGDAENALPALMNALGGRTDLDRVPNLAWRDPDTGRIHTTALDYVDLDETLAPHPEHDAPVLPYESMRGCPFTRKFCSFPAASPRWRHKSADTIRRDFQRYRGQYQTRFIKAMDSTFTVPPRRLSRLLPQLTGTDVRWEAYSRANAITDHQLVDRLSDAGCAALALGFESMSNHTLNAMNKKVSATANRTALELLADSDIEHRASFMVGYPGEHPENYAYTHDFLTREYCGRFSLYVFSLSDETMPVWSDAERFALHVEDPDDPDSGWHHIGMDHDTAHQLRADTLTAVRWNNDNAVLGLWQGAYEMPLMPTRSDAANLRVEKTIERLAMSNIDIDDDIQRTRTRHRLFGELDHASVLNLQPGTATTAVINSASAQPAPSSSERPS